MVNMYSERLAKAMQYAGFTVTKMSEKLGISYQSVKKVLDGKSKAFSAENNVVAAKLCGVDAYWLATGGGKMIPDVAAQQRVIPLGKAWPFQRISPEQWEALTTEHRNHIEMTVRMMMGLPSGLSTSEMVEKRLA